MSPIFEKLKLWLREQSPHHLPQGPMAKATQYTLNQWDELERVLGDAKLRLDNNIAENALLIVALGRKSKRRRVQRSTRSCRVTGSELRRIIQG
jgi:transposase